jgi:hypothetical protein
MKKSPFPVVLVFLGLLASCGTNPGSSVSSTGDVSSEPTTSSVSTSSASSSSATSEVISYLPNEPTYKTNPKVDVASFTYSQRLAEPSHTVASVKELSALMDYAAFYHLSSIEATLSYSFKSGSKEMNAAYWASSILPCAVDLDLTATSGSTLTIAFTYYREGYKHYDNSSQFYTHSGAVLPGKAYTETAKRADDFSSFPYRSRTQKVEVVSTQQLLYTLTHGYQPVALANTPAATAVNQMEGILRKIIQTDMSDLEKLSAIYRYVGTHVCYEFAGDTYAGNYSQSAHPNALVAEDDGFFLEGALQGFGVCEGYSKLFAALAGMESLPVYNCSGFPRSFDYQSSRYSVSGGTWETHAYNYVLLDQQYYLLDPSWNQGNYSNNSVLEWSWVLVSKLSHENYSESFKDVADLDPTIPFATSPYDLFSKLTYQQDGVAYDFTIDSQEELNAFAKQFALAKASSFYSYDGRYLSATCEVGTAFTITASAVQTAAAAVGTSFSFSEYTESYRDGLRYATFYSRRA